MDAIRWTHGDVALGRAVAAALARGHAETLRDDARRVLSRARLDDGRDVLVKQFRVGSGRHALRERIKAQIGRAPAAREWRHLVALHERGMRVPAPLALGVRRDGDRLLLLEWIEGVPLPAALAASFEARRALLVRLGEAANALHAHGFAHGDLHAGNVIVCGSEPVLIDWQHARRTASPRARRADLARLEHALAPLVSRGLRMRLRRAVLGAAATPDALRDAGRAADAHARAHARSRTQHACRPGRVARSIDVHGARGLALRDVDPDALAALLAAHDAAVRARDAALLETGARAHVSAGRLGARPVIVKETPWRGLGRALADTVRGSAAVRGWRGGHGLRARRIGAAEPVAALTRRRLGLPIASWLVLEDLRPAPTAVAALERGAPDAATVLDAVTTLAIALHRARVDHGDLKGTHVFLTDAAGRCVPRLIDLEGVRFRHRLADARRVHALAELNASLPDALPGALRRRAFARYAAALPFAGGAGAALRKIVRESLARRHRWSGADCDAGSAREAARPSPSPPRAIGSSWTSAGSCRRGPARSAATRRLRRCR
jgi:tRNA A-37 threonylcarbamoyl transferase component Bud32